MVKIQIEAYILFLGTLTMCCMGVAMIYVGATYEDDVSTYLIVSGIFKLIIYSLPLLFVSIYITEEIISDETKHGDVVYEAINHLVLIFFIFPPLLLVPLAYLGILIWGTIIASCKKSSSKS